MDTLMEDANVLLPGVRKRGYRVWFAHQLAARGETVISEVTTGPMLKARIDHGRWLADCPYCRGAELVTLDDPVFLCLSCGNVVCMSQFLPVQFPNEQRRNRIEELLIIRPLPNRNWRTGESVEDLKRENRKNAYRLRGTNGSPR